MLLHLLTHSMGRYPFFTSAVLPDAHNAGPCVLNPHPVRACHTSYHTTFHEANCVAAGLHGSLLPPSPPRPSTLWPASCLHSARTQAGAHVRPQESDEHMPIPISQRPPTTCRHTHPWERVGTSSGRGWSAPSSSYIARFNPSVQEHPGAHLAWPPKLILLLLLPMPACLSEHNPSLSRKGAIGACSED